MLIFLFQKNLDISPFFIQKLCRFILLSQSIDFGSWRFNFLNEILAFAKIKIKIRVYDIKGETCVLMNWEREKDKL